MMAVPRKIPKQRDKIFQQEKCNLNTNTNIKILFLFVCLKKNCLYLKYTRILTKFSEVFSAYLAK